MNIEEFIQQNRQQIKSYSLKLQALWHDYQGKWQKSHKLIDRDCARVHAYLHGVEGDLGNARYWCRLSGRSESKLSLTEQRQQIAQALLKQF